MSPGLIIVLILVAGVVAVGAATIADLRSVRRVNAAGHVQAELQVPPDVERPSYQSTSELLANAPAATRPDAEWEEQLAQRLGAPGACAVKLRLAELHFATHTGRRFISDQPRILICADAPQRLRELLGPLREAALTHQTLVIAAPSFAENVLNTLIANKLADLLQVAALVGESSELSELARLSGGHLIEAPTRQADAIASSDYGTVSLLVADEQHTRIIAAKD